MKPHLTVLGCWAPCLLQYYKHLRGLPLQQVRMCSHQVSISRANRPCPVSSCHLYWPPHKAHGNREVTLSAPHTTPMEDKAKGTMAGWPAEGKLRQGQEKAVTRVAQALILLQANTFAQQGPMALERVSHFQHSCPRRHHNHKYFLQITFLATLK